MEQGKTETKAVEPRITAIYCRTSTGNQTTGLESQIRACKLYCEQNNIFNYKMYLDEGISGARTNRPALRNMNRDIEQGKVGRVVVYSFSRLFRSVVNLLETLDGYKKLAIQFVSITEKVDTSTPFGKAMLNIVATIGELERDLAAERIKNGLKNAVAKGVILGKRPKLSHKDLVWAKRKMEEGWLQREVAEYLKIDRITLYKYINGYHTSDLKKHNQKLKPYAKGPI